MKTKKLTLLSLLTAIALTIFMVEAQIPALVPIPGVKMGLANIVTVFAVFALGPREGASVLFVRIFLGAVFAGNFSTIFYSAAGGLCAFLVTLGLKRVLTDKQLWVAGCFGAVAHSLQRSAEGFAAFVFTVIDKNHPGLFPEACQPGKQTFLVCMTGSTVQGSDLGMNGDLFPKQFDILCTLLELSAHGADGLEANKEDDALFPPQVVL